MKTRIWAGSAPQNWNRGEILRGFWFVMILTLGYVTVTVSLLLGCYEIFAYLSEPKLSPPTMVITPQDVLPPACRPLDDEVPKYEI